MTGSIQSECFSSAHSVTDQLSLFITSAPGTVLFTWIIVNSFLTVSKEFFFPKGFDRLYLANFQSRQMNGVGQEASEGLELNRRTDRQIKPGRERVWEEVKQDDVAKSKSKNRDVFVRKRQGTQKTCKESGQWL